MEIEWNDYGDMLDTPMQKEHIASEAWNLVKKWHDSKLSEEEQGKLYQYLIVLMGDNSLYEALKDTIGN